MIENELRQTCALNETERSEAEEELIWIQARLAFWKDFIVKNNSIDQASLTQASKDLKKFNTESLRVETNNLILKECELEFRTYKASESKSDWFHEACVENDLELGHLIITKTLNMDNISVIDELKITKGITSVTSLKMKIFSNGTYFLSFVKSKGVNVLAIYSPEKEHILKQIEFDKRVDVVKLAANKIVMTSSLEKTKHLTIIDHNLNIIQAKSIALLDELIGANDTALYCIDQRYGLVCFDWSLNKRSASIKFNFDDESAPFHIPEDSICSDEFEIRQFENLNDLYIIRIETRTVCCPKHNLILMYDRSGNRISKTQVIIILFNLLPNSFCRKFKKESRTLLKLGYK